MSKPLRIALDFDGTVHAYDSSWTTALKINDGPVEGAIEWLEEMVKHASIIIWSCRINPDNGKVDPSGVRRVAAIDEWLAAHGLSEFARNRLSFWLKRGKPHADVYLDDRGVRFEGKFPTLEELSSLSVPWNKKTAKAHYRCKECGGTDVQMVEWVFPNRGTIADGEPFLGDLILARDRGRTYCLDCEDHTLLEYVE